ncbi:MAG: hypothetical protein ACRD1G_15045 [Acidimicrobiales bacterium]
MTIGVQIDFPGATLDQYDQAIERMGYLPSGPSAQHELFHWVTKTENGIRVVDVWESREAYEEFAEERVRPVASEVGISEPPEVGFFDVYNYLTGGRWHG